MKQPKILDLKPTQFVLGMKEIESKIAKMEKMDRKGLIAYCDEHVIPVVIGPKKELYLIDHHHFAYACWELNVGAYSVEVLEDLSHKSEPDFWNTMIRKKWCHLNDQFGMGPHSPYALPSDIRCMADDPYRSLVWAVIDQGLIKKDKTPFFEFMWAEYFRFNLDMHLHAKSNFKDAIAQAKKLAKSKNARTFPGFLGK